MEKHLKEKRINGVANQLMAGLQGSHFFASYSTDSQAAGGRSQAKPHISLCKGNIGCLKEVGQQTQRGTAGITLITVARHAVGFLCGLYN